jgi:hypothetical protein
MLSYTVNGGKKSEKNEEKKGQKGNGSKERGNKKRAKAGRRGPGICAQNNRKIRVQARCKP